MNNIIIDVKMFDKKVFNLYVQTENFEKTSSENDMKKIGSFELKDLEDVILSFAKKYNTQTICLIGNKAYCEGLRTKIATEEKIRNGCNNLLIEII